ncbi:flagellar biosynthesis protein FlhB [Iodidimonas muriae]|uniref:Flagellar biosynthetic protein FlhB n=1 Tax=Iodidimonas muriae TaxID=261467 RepID=A0ABQ2LFL4_9PROT|nr:flagellar biosynthesis protein FlhB [Iodidimonas muriae]GER08598.1 flagellar biosynthesis protein FlhB [Kordiimonadales bacterium JCM 17843]GGO15484.1 flagellar biosynthesis protein FlhB [Iodidimonas muriae]
MAAENQDQSQKTEEPTEKKLDEARKKGNLPLSREVTGAMSILAAVVLAGFYMSSFSAIMSDSLATLIVNAHDIDVHTAQGDLRALAVGIMLAIAGPLLVIAAFFAVSAFLSVWMQNGLMAAVERITPKVERVSPIAGFKRLFSLSSIVEFLKSVGKVLAVGLTVAVIIYSELDSAGNATGYAPDDMARLMLSMTVRLLFAVLLVYVVIAVLDVLWRRFDWLRQLRMTRKEVKDEHKQMEGDPQIKARLREIRRERTRRRMMADVPSASVVLMNPTHYAIALRYDRGKTPAPLCLAKGVDRVALKIREVAQEAGVPVVETPGLARALYPLVEIKGLVPPEFYRQIAQILTVVMKQDRRQHRRKQHRQTFE